MSWSEKELLDCFKMPTGSAITGRTTSIRNVFVTAIIPTERPRADEIRQVLEILELDPQALQCCYCGNPATEWDHLHPLVKDGKPTGHITCIRNLVPSCNKCNQSKGKSHWKEWILGPAPRSPFVRRVPDLDHRVARLERFEAWGNCIPLKVADLAPKELWGKYYALQDEILLKMRDAQKLAVLIAREIKDRTSAPPPKKGDAD